MRVDVVLLGGFEVRVGGRRVPDEEWRRRQAASLIKLLALAPGRTLHREQVMDALWPEVGIDQAGPRLHKAAHYARRACGHADAVTLVGERVSLFPSAEVAVDAIEFEARAKEALRNGGAADSAVEIARIAEGYTGDLLPQDLYEPWTETSRDTLRGLQLELLRQAGQWEALVQADPGNEPAHLELVRSLAASGDRRAALRQFERMERALRSELGLRPSPAATALRAALLTAESAESSESTNTDGAPGQRDLKPIGRDPHLRRAAQLLAQAESGAGGTLFVSGPAGIGKSSFLAWTEQLAAKRGWRIGTGVAASIEGAWPYAPVLEALADLCRRHPALLDGLADTYRLEIEQALSGGRAGAWTGESSHQRLFVSTSELLRLAAAGSGLILFVDDVHEADDASLRLLHFLARCAVSERVLIVLAHRPWPTRAALDEMKGSLIARGTASAIDLGPLEDAAIRHLIRRQVTDPEVVESLVQLAGGVPFAAHEMARAAASFDGGSSSIGSLALRNVPTEIVDVLRRVSVLGVTFDTDEFVSLTGLAEDDAFGRLDVALGAGAIVRTGTGYQFRHSLVREALLDGLPPHRLQPLHRSAATALKRLGASPARVGHQLLQAADPTAAAPFLLQAAHTEASVGAYRDALALVDSVRFEAQHPHRGPLLALRADLLMAAGDAGALAAYREALAATDDPQERRQIRAQLARAALFAADFDTAAAALEGLDLDGGPNDPAILLARGHLAMYIGDLNGAQIAADEARRRLTLAGPYDWRIFDLVGLQGLLAHNRGEWFQRLAAELRAGADRPDLAVAVFDSHLCVAEYLLYGPTPYEEVLSLAASLRDSARRSGVLRAVAFATALRGEAALLMGDLTLAESELREAADLHHDLGSTAGEAHSLQRWAEVRLARGDRAQAMHLLHRALPLARWSAIADHLLQRLYGSMIVAAPDPESARAMVDRAEATLGHEDACIFCRVMLEVPAVRACAEVGDVTEARRHLAAAEQSAARWEGTAWTAAIMEARAHLARAEADAEGADRLLREAAELFESAGQPLDAARCLA